VGGYYEQNKEERDMKSLEIEALPRLDPRDEGPLGWMSEGICAQTDVDLFTVEGRKKHSVKAAKAVCARCLVTDECLQYALDNDLEGVFGGTTTEERKRMKKVQRSA